MLSDISKDILLLLGISAAGAAGSKMAEISKKTLSFANWSWLCNQGWLTVAEAEMGRTSDPSRTHWGDLLKTDGSYVRSPARQVKESYRNSSRGVPSVHCSGPRGSADVAIAV